MPITFYPEQRRDADAVLWWQAVVAAGGTVSGVQLRYVSTLIRALKACGAWGRRDDYAAYCAENAIQARVTLKKRITQTLAHASTTDPTFIANRGFLGNRDGYINTGWNPTTLGNYARDDAGWLAHIYSAPVSASDREMSSDSANFNEFLINATNVLYGVEQGSLTSYAHAGTMTGLFQFNRTASTATSARQNGAQKTTGSVASIALVSQNFYVLAGNNGGTPFLPADSGISMAGAGGSLTSVQLDGEWLAWRAFLTACGVP